MRDILSYSGDEISKSLQDARGNQDKEYGIKVLFSPVRINDDNFKQVSELFSQIISTNYETVVVLESCDKELIKKIPMPSLDVFETPLGKVLVNDRMRNEFCDEEDDFFIDDSAYHEDLSLFHQLMMLQCSLDKFNVVSIQISNYERVSIARELALVLDELLLSRNVLLLICCDMPIEQKRTLERLKRFVKEGEKSNLLNVINSDSIQINGKTAFLVGLLVCSTWNVDLHFLNDHYSVQKGNSLIAGFASLKDVSIGVNS